MKFINGTVRWGIIGCGDVCEVKSGPAFNKVAHSELVAVMRRDAAKAEDFARRHSVPRFYSDAAQLIADENVNAIYIATPPSSHEAYVRMALSSGKPVYVEKPVALNAASCQRMIDDALAAGVPVVAAHYRRALPLFVKVKELIREQTIGAVRMITIRLLQRPKVSVIENPEAHWRVNPEISGGGLFHDLAPHQLDILTWILGEPVSLTGRSLNQSKQYNAPDFVSMEGIFNNGICFQGLWSFSAPEIAADETCTIIGEKGMISFSFFSNAPLKIGMNDTWNEIRFDTPLHIQQPMISKTVNYFRGQGENPCPLEEAIVTLRMMDGVGG